jgi:acyl carrier protein
MENANRERVWSAITEVTSEVLVDQGLTPGPMTPATLIHQDLGISSIDFVHMLLTLEDKIGQTFEFEKIALRDGEYRTDLTLGELHEFLLESGAADGLSGALAAG